MSSSSRQSEDGLAESTRKVSFNESSVDGKTTHICIFSSFILESCVLKNIYIIKTPT